LSLATQACTPTVLDDLPDESGSPPLRPALQLLAARAKFL